MYRDYSIYTANTEYLPQFDLAVRYYMVGTGGEV